MRQGRERAGRTVWDEQGQAILRASWTLALLTLSLIVAFTDRQALNLVVDPIRKEIGVDDLQIGLLQGGAFAIFFAIVGLPLGRAVDIYSRKRIIMAGVLIWSIATFFGALATSYGGLFLARVFVGIGEATLLPAGTSLIADVFRTRMARDRDGPFLLGHGSGQRDCEYRWRDTPWNDPRRRVSLGCDHSWLERMARALLPDLSSRLRADALASDAARTGARCKRRGAAGAHAEKRAAAIVRAP